MRAEKLCLDLEDAGCGLLGQLPLGAALQAHPLRSLAGLFGSFRYVSESLAEFATLELSRDPLRLIRERFRERIGVLIAAPVISGFNVRYVLESAPDDPTRAFLARLLLLRGTEASAINAEVASGITSRIDRRTDSVTIYGVPGYFDSPPGEHVRVDIRGAASDRPTIELRDIHYARVAAPEAQRIAIDTVIARALGDAAFRKELGALLTANPWDHLVEALELASIRHQPRDPEPVAWRVTGLESGRVHTVELVRCKETTSGKKAKARRTWVQVERGAARAWADASDSPLDAADIELFQLITHRDEYGVARDKVVTHDHALPALMRLIQHNNVVNSRGESLRVRRAAVDLRVVRASPESVRLELWIGTVAYSEEAGRRAASWARTQNAFAVAYDHASHTLYVGHAPAALEPLSPLLRAINIDIPERGLAAVLTRLPDLSKVVPVSIADELVADRRPVRARLVARATRVDGAVEISLKCAIDGSSARFWPGAGPRQQFVGDAGGVLIEERDFDAERTLAANVCGLPALAALARTEHGAHRAVTREQAVEALDALRQSHVEVEWIDSREPRLYRAATGQAHLKLSSGRDWFGVDGAVEVDDIEVPLAALLAAIRDNQKVVVIDDDRWVVLEDHLRKAFEPLSRLLDAERATERRLSPLHGPLLDSLAAEGVKVDAPKAFRERREKIAAAMTGQPAVHTALNAELRPYQLEGFRWLARMSVWSPGACLADDMGLGKTVQTLALLLHRADSGAALVVAPTSLTYNWLAEAARFAPSLEIVRWEPKKSPPPAELLRPQSVVVISYDLLVIHAASFEGLHWHTLVVDEAQAVKNANTQRAQVLAGIDAAFKLALTGTPIENRTAELWSLFALITPGYLADQKAFARRFANPIERMQDQAARATLATLVRPFILRRLKGDVAPELPPKIEKNVIVELGAKERSIYEKVRKAAIGELRKQGGGARAAASSPQARFLILAALTRLRQAACHARLIDADAPAISAKQQVLVDMLDELVAEGRRVLVFSQFTSLFDLIEPGLHEMGIEFGRLDGTTAPVERKRLVDAFQGESFSVFLLSLKAGGTGLNLTAADVVIHLDPWWNPAVEDQATDRAHRIGQARVVQVIRLVAQETVEQSILAMHAQKRELVDAMLSGSDQAATIGTDELLALLST